MFRNAEGTDDKLVASLDYLPVNVKEKRDDPGDDYQPVDSAAISAKEFLIGVEEQWKKNGKEEDAGEGNLLQDASEKAGYMSATAVLANGVKLTRSCRHHLILPETRRAEKLLCLSGE
jgi:hypothetical protein